MAKTRSVLAAAQRAWIAFRGAQRALIGSGVAGGSIQPTIVASCLADLTSKRINDFKAYLNCEEGDLRRPLPPKQVARPPPKSLGARNLRHCERSEAIQEQQQYSLSSGCISRRRLESLMRLLDCFAALAMTQVA